MMTWSLGGLSLFLAGARPAPSHHRSRTRRDGAAPAWATADHSAKGNRTWQTADWPSKRRLTLHRPNRALRSSPTSMTWGKTEPSRAASRPLRGAQWTSSPHLAPARTPPTQPCPSHPPHLGCCWLNPSTCSARTSWNNSRLLVLHPVFDPQAAPS